MSVPGEEDLKAADRVVQANIDLRGGLRIALLAVYLQDGVGIMGNRDLLSEIGRSIGDTRLWIAAGDWNCEPQDLLESGWLDMVKGTIVEQEHDCTYTNGSARELDFFVVSEELAPALRGTGFDLAAGWRPHAAVCAQLMKRPRALVARQLLAPRRAQEQKRSTSSAAEAPLDWAAARAVVGTE